jgi:hypothetical protein
MTTIQTLFGTFDDEKIKALKGNLEEMIIVMQKQDRLKAEMKDIIDASFEALKIPKKILRKMARVKYKDSFNDESSENKEFEALYESVSDTQE